MPDRSSNDGGDGGAGTASAREGSSAVSSRVVDEARNVRRLSLSGLAVDDVDALLALRSVAIRDEDAELRALAIQRIGRLDSRALATEPATGQDEARARAACRAALGEAVADALRDESPLVREAAARAAATLREPRAEAPLRAMIGADRAWQARRAAIRALAAIAREASADALFEALDDPFWRVRYAAVQALAGWPDAPLQHGPRSPRVTAALEYMESIRRGELAADDDPPEPAVVRPDPPPASAGVPSAATAPYSAASEALVDDDPAVMAARLAAAPAEGAPASLLIAALASPHDSLRRAAVSALAARADLDELAAALGWLDDPRAPYAGDATRRLLRRVDARPLCDRVLLDPSARPGALAWALDLAARDARRAVPHASPDVVSTSAERALSHPDPAARRAAVHALASLGAEEALLRALSDPDEPTRAEVVAALEPALDDPAVRAALDVAVAPAPREAASLDEALPEQPATAPDSPPPETGLFVERALLGALRVWPGREMTPDTSAWIAATLRRASVAPWSDVRAEAITLRARRGELAAEERARHCSDPDPWLREAAMDAERGARALAVDPDPFVRRAAARVALGPTAPRALRAEAAHLGARSSDPWIRAKAAGSLDTRSDEGLAALLRLTRDPAPMVRAAAADALGRTNALLPRCIRAVHHETTPEDVRLAAHARLAATPSADSLAALVRDLASPHLSRAARDTLRAISLVYPEDLRASAPSLAPPAGSSPPPSAEPPSTLPPSTSPSTLPLSGQPTGGTPSPPPERRPLGATGLLVAPLGLSGAGDLPPACFAEARAAGVNLFFWEPDHPSLTAFASRSARRHDLVIVTGSYEADRRSIERDVERALTRLRIDAVGVMLLFWVRSRARLLEGAHDTLLRLKQQGKVRAIGFSTHLRDLAAEAIAAQPWDVVMCRLSAAHPGAEHTLLPAAAARGTGIIAFSALSYGRLLAPWSAPPITAADCYRYALSQPAVSACLSAPRRWRELSENLSVLPHPTLPPADIARLRAHGARVHETNRSFTTLVHRT